jgi:hypothetical protein
LVFTVDILQEKCIAVILLEKENNNGNEDGECQNRLVWDWS